MSIQTTTYAAPARAAPMSDVITCDGCREHFLEPVVTIRHGMRHVAAGAQINYDERRDGWFCDDCADCRETAEDHADNRRKAA